MRGYRCNICLFGLVSFLRRQSACPRRRAVTSGDYGFLPPEIYKLDPRTKNLLLRDINGDGLLDVIVVNNLKNCIDLLQQRKDPNDKSPSAPRRRNQRD